MANVFPQNLHLGFLPEMMNTKKNYDYGLALLAKPVAARCALTGEINIEDKKDNLQGDTSGSG